eukprot:scaffold32850_cov18-Tisochrysis_lutea.AAC.1
MDTLWDWPPHPQNALKQAAARKMASLPLWSPHLSKWPLSHRGHLIFQNGFSPTVVTSSLTLNQTSTGRGASEAGEHLRQGVAA